MPPISAGSNVQKSLASTCIQLTEPENKEVTVKIVKYMAPENNPVNIPFCRLHFPATKPKTKEPITSAAKEKGKINVAERSSKVTISAKTHSNIAITPMPTIAPFIIDFVKSLVFVLKLSFFIKKSPRIILFRVIKKL